MDSAEMRETRYAESDHVATMPQRVSVNKSHRLLCGVHLVCAGCPVTARLILINGVIQPTLLRRPICNLRLCTFFENLLRDDRVIRQFHLIDSLGVGFYLQTAPHSVAPLR